MYVPFDDGNSISNGAITANGDRSVITSLTTASIIDPTPLRIGFLRRLRYEVTNCNQASGSKKLSGIGFSPGPAIEVRGSGVRGTVARARTCTAEPEPAIEARGSGMRTQNNTQLQNIPVPPSMQLLIARAGATLPLVVGGGLTLSRPLFISTSFSHL